MQGIRQGVLDGPRPALPVGVVVQPVAAEGNVGPGADMRDALDQVVAVAVDAVEPLEMAADPLFGQAAVVAHQAQVAVRQKLAVDRKSTGHRNKWSLRVY